MGLLGRRVERRRLGLAAAAVCAVYPLMIVVDGALMSETAYTPLVVLVLLVGLVGCSSGRGSRCSPALGALIGIAALVRSEALLLLPLLAWPVALRGGSGLAAARARRPSLACAAALAPWTIRNAIEFGHLIPISINDSTVLRGANCDADLRGPGHRLLAPGLHPVAALRQRGRPGGVLARRRAASTPASTPGGSRWSCPVRILRTFSLYQPRRQVLFAEGRWVRGEQAAVACLLPARAARDRGRGRAAAPRRAAAGPARARRGRAGLGRDRLRPSAAAARVRALADAARRGGRAVAASTGGESARSRAAARAASAGSPSRATRASSAHSSALRGSRRGQALNVSTAAGLVARAELEHADALLDAHVRVQEPARRSHERPRFARSRAVGFSFSSASVAISSWAEKLRAATASHAAPARASTIDDDPGYRGGHDRVVPPLAAGALARQLRRRRGDPHARTSSATGRSARSRAARRSWS